MASETTTSWDPPSALLPKLKYVLLAVGPMAILMSASMGPGSISSLVIAGSELGYTAVWLAAISGWLAAAVYYVGAKVCTLTDETPVEVVNRYTHPAVSFVLFIGLLYVWYFVVAIEGHLLAATTEALIPALAPYIVPVVLLQIAVIAVIFAGGFDVVKGVLSALVVFLAAVFLINAFYIGPEPSAVAGGLVPTLLEAGVGEIGFAGIVGGSIGVGPIWYAYIAKDNGWGRDSLKFMASDQVVFYGILFSIFSIGIYVSAAATLQGVTVADGVDAAHAIEPIAGPLAALLFTVGLWAAVFTTLGGMAAVGAYLVGDLINNLPVVEMEIELSLDNRIIKGLTIIGIVLGSVGLFLRGPPPLPFMAYGVGLLTIVAPITIFVFTLATVRPTDVGEFTGPWYLVVGLTVAFLVSLYAAYLTGLHWVLVSVVVILGVVLNTLYHEWRKTDRLTPTGRLDLDD